MRRDALEFLRCPQCMQPLHLNHRQAVDADAVDTGSLFCPAGHSYAISRGVPRFVRIEELDEAQRQTMEVFSAQWDRFGEVTIDERAFAISRRWLLARYGWGDEEGVQRFLADKKVILDAGSASGRYAHLFARMSGNTVFGAEIGDGVDVAVAHFGATPNLFFVQACIPDLPFAPGTFDFIMCDGVLHHTSHPKGAFDGLVARLKPGGQLAIYVYHTGNPLREMTDEFMIDALARKGIDESLRASRAMTEVAQEVAASTATVDVPAALALLNVPAGCYSLYDFLYWFVIRLHFDCSLPFDKNWSTNFGWFAPINASRYTGDEVLSWFREHDMEVLYQDIGPRGISIRARKS